MDATPLQLQLYVRFTQQFLVSIKTMFRMKRNVTCSGEVGMEV